MKKEIQFILLLIIVFYGISCTKIEEIKHPQINEAFVTYEDITINPTISRTLWFKIHQDTNLASVNDGLWCPNVVYTKYNNVILFERGEWLTYDIKIIINYRSTNKKAIITLYKKFHYDEDWVLISKNAYMKISN